MSRTEQNRIEEKKREEYGTEKIRLAKHKLNQNNADDKKRQERSKLNDVDDNNTKK